MPAQAAFDIIGKKRKAPASGPVPPLTACLLQRGILVTGEKKKKKYDATDKKYLYLFKDLHILYSLLPVFPKFIFFKIP